MEIQHAGRPGVIRMLGAGALALATALPAGAQDELPLAITNGIVYLTPGNPPLPDATVIITNGRITFVGAGVTVRKAVRTIDARGLVVMPGFWNGHVHFAMPEWLDAATLPADRLASQLQAMLTSYGFTTVVDTGSFLDNTNALRRRVQAGEIPGPRILTAGEILFPHELPYYVKDAIAPALLATFPRPRTSREAEAAVESLVARGADLIKLYGVSMTSRTASVAMQTDVARAAVAAAHRHGRIVYVHPTSEAGARLAIDAGADVLAHAVEIAPHWDTLLPDIRRAGLTMIPTLTLFAPTPLARFINRTLSRTDVVAEVRDVAAGGGVIVFGTDVGYIREFNTEREYALMAAAGLSADDILKSLTAAPAALFKDGERGRVIPGMAGDVTILAADPHADVRNFARVRYVVRDGRVIYAGAAQPAVATPFYRRAGLWIGVLLVAAVVVLVRWRTGRRRASA